MHPTFWLGTLVLMVGASWLLLAHREAPPRHFANADDARLVAAGEGVYRTRCAACHGARLEGQPNWQVAAPDGTVRAPPQDETGHSWMHDDEQLYRFVRYSMRDIAAPGYVSPMPAFDGLLNDHEISAVLAFIKSRWPTGVRVYQAMLNPGEEGIPAAAAGLDWTLPADCGTELGGLPPQPREQTQ